MTRHGVARLARCARIGHLYLPCDTHCLRCSFPRNPHVALVRGEITVEQYVANIKDEVDRRLR